MLDRPDPIDYIEDRYSPFIRIDEVVGKYLEEEPWNNYEKVTGLRSGLSALDRHTGGFQPGEIIVVAGCSDAFLQHVALNIAALEHSPVAYFSLSTKKTIVAHNLIAGIAGVELGRIRTGNLSSDQKEHLKKTREKFVDVPLLINDTDGQSVYDIRRHIQEYLMGKEEIKPVLIVIDCLQMIVPWGRYVSRKNQIDEILNELETLAHSTEIPIIIGSQFYPACPSREFEQIPRLSDLISHPETALVDNYADKIFFTFRDDLETMLDEHGERYDSYGGPEYPDDHNSTRIIVAKCPNGIGACMSLKDDELFKISEV